MDAMDPYLRYLERPSRRRYSRFVLAYIGPVSRLAGRLVHSPDLAEDVVQDVFVRLGTVKKGPEEISNPRAYIFRTALNVARGQRKRQETHNHREEQAIQLRERYAPAAITEVMDDEAVRRLYRAMDALPEVLRVAIHLRAVEGLSYRDIAAVTGASISAVSTRIQRAREELKRLLGRAGFAVPVLDLEPLRSLAWLSEVPAPLPDAVLRRLLREIPRSRSQAVVPKLRIVLVGATAATLALLLLYRDEHVTNDPQTVAVRGSSLAPPSIVSRGTTRDGRSDLESEKLTLPPPRDLDRPADPPHSPPELEEQNPEPEKEIRSHPKNGDEVMNRSLLAASVGLSLAVSTAASAQNLGDINGDGRVSFGDAFRLHRWVQTGLTVFEPAAGSMEFEPEIVCTANANGETPLHHLDDLVYMEALRRASSNPLPHFIEKWPEPPELDAASPPPDGSVRLEVLAVVYETASDQVELEVRLTNTIPLDFVALLMRAEGLDLRPRHPLSYRARVPPTELISSTEYYVLTGGLLAFHSDELQFTFATSRKPKTLEPSEGTILKLHAVLPRGTEPGIYSIELLPQTEVVTPFGEIIRPEMHAGTLEVKQRITGGHDLAFPPIEFVDLVDRRIGGASEVRITRAEGNPEDEIHVTVQVRTERPVNWLEFRLLFDAEALRAEELEHLYVDPEHGVPRTIDHYQHLFNKAFSPDTGGGTVTYHYYPLAFIEDERLPDWMRNARRDYTPYYRTLGTPTLKYLTPLDEWIDLARIRFTILPEARGRGRIPLRFVTDYSECAFVFYGTNHHRSGVGSAGDDCDLEASWWEYEPTRWHTGEVMILGGGEPPPDPAPPIDPELANIRFLLAAPEEHGEPPEIRGRPGEIVEIPVYMMADTVLWQLRMVFGFDLEQLELVRFEGNFQDSDGVPLTLFVPEEVERGWIVRKFNRVAVQTPEGIRHVPGLFPFSVLLHMEGATEGDRVPENVLFVDLQTTYHSVSQGGKEFWSPGELYEVGTALFRIREDAAPGRTEISGSETGWLPTDAVTSVHSVSSGYPPFDRDQGPLLRYDVPATVRPAVIVILEPTDFVRGDANGDGDLDLSDPVHTLKALFVGGVELDCEDAADANDDGGLNLADAIHVLTHLFDSGAPPLPPFPEPGADPTTDDLACDRE